jgi:hypothetical protein
MRDKLEEEVRLVEERSNGSMGVASEWLVKGKRCRIEVGLHLRVHAP